MKFKHRGVNNSATRLRRWVLLLAVGSSTAFAAPPSPNAPDGSAGRAGGAQAVATTLPPACPASLNYTFARLQDEKPQSLCQYAGKVVVVVNTASFCGFTGQYKGLEALYAKYKDQGLVVLGFPSNDFSQETGSNKDIADFCENTFGVKFPMFGKTSVRGKAAVPFFQQLAAATGAAPSWNFHKYVIARDGKVIAHYPSGTTPEDRGFLKEIEKQLR